MTPRLDVAGIETGTLTTIIIGTVGVVWRAIRRTRHMLSDIHTELITQRTNCLATLQTQGLKQIEVLEKIDKNIAEQNGFIRGWIEGQR